MNKTELMKSNNKSSEELTTARAKLTTTELTNAQHQFHNLTVQKNCTKTIVVVKEKTSSALIILGILFIVVVIGLFYYLPKWSPKFARNIQSGSYDIGKTTSIFFMRLLKKMVHALFSRKLAESGAA